MVNEGPGFSPEPTIGVDFKVLLRDMPPIGKVKFQIWDTSGQERFRTITSSYYRGAHCAILCFDVTKAESFLQIKDYWLQQIERYASQDIPMILCALKCDLASQRVVSRQEAIDFARSHDFPYVEASSATGRGAELVLPSLMNGQQPLIDFDSGESSRVPVIASEICIVGDCSLPLTSVSFSVQAKGNIASVSSVFTFRSANEITEAAFPIPCNSVTTLTAFVLTLNGRVMNGILQANSSAITSNQLPTLKEGTLALSLGGIPARVRGEISTTWVTEMPFNGIGFQFVYPILSPKSSNSGFLDGTITYHHELPITMHCNLLSYDVKSQSPSETVLTINRGRCPSSDLDVIIKTIPPNGATQITTEGDLAVALHVVPQINFDYCTTCFVAVLDCSQTMFGNKWNHLKRACQIFLASLPPDCYFNVIKFGTTCESTFGLPVRYTQETMKNAMGIVSNWETSSSTDPKNVYDPLKMIVESRTMSSAPTKYAVVLVTDGGISAERTSVISLVQGRDMFIYTVGVGPNVDTEFLSTISSCTGGKTQIVSSEVGIESAVVNQLAFASGQKFDANLSWGTLPTLCASQFPFIASKTGTVTLTSGKLTTEYALCCLGSPSPGVKMATAVYTANIFGQSYQWDLDITTPTEENNSTTSPLHQMAAFCLSTVHPELSNALALRYNIMSHSVSFAIPAPNDPTPATTTTIPYRTLHLIRPPTSKLLSLQPYSPQPSVITLYSRAKPNPSASSSSSSSCCGRGGGQTPSWEVVEAPKSAASAGGGGPEDRLAGILDALVRSQHAHGFFEAARLCQEPSLSFFTKKNLFPTSDPSSTTCLVLAVLTIHLPSLADEWLLFSGKARAWLGKFGVALEYSFTGAMTTIHSTSLA
ncbi:ras protein [Pelomyxa schiedti]|nr:ras protein [Pelomyxa schiedti]